MIGMVANYQKIDSSIGAAVKVALAARGVPTGIDSANLLAGDLYPEMLAARAELSARERALLSRANPELQIPENIPYSEKSLRKVVYKSTGLTPGSPLANIEVFDVNTREMSTIKVAPYAMPDSDDVLEVVAKRISAGLGRHARGASRDLVIATARANQVRWARQLSGAENCGWCAMLTSRGAVYSEKTVRFQAHDNCDCTATLVRNSGDWQGKEESEKLARMWAKSGNLADFTKSFRGAQDEISA